MLGISNEIKLFALHEEIRKYLEELQNQLSRDVFRKRCSENMQHFYRKTPMPKYDFGRMFPIDHKKYQESHNEGTDTTCSF